MNWARIEEGLARRDFVFRSIPSCPSCQETMQIQCMSWFTSPAQWKCRMCKHKFTFEPPMEERI